ncbi:MAG: hypothetical protein ACRCYO_17395 [Bacteroidia bacterium]
MKKLTWKFKNRLLLLAAIALLWIIYSFSVRNTFETRSTCIRLEKKLDSASGAPQRQIVLERELSMFNQLLGQTDSLGGMHEHLLGVVSSWCQEKQVVLREIPAPLRYTTRDWLVETHTIVVEGNFIDLLRFAEQLEKEKSFRLVSTDYKTLRDPKTKRLVLTATYYLQNILNEAS